MIRAFAVLAAVLCFAGIYACSSKEKAPAGRWEGTYEEPGMMVVARLETAAGGSVRVSAPDALGIEASEDADREIVRQRLAQGLAAGWDQVTPRPMEFDGRTFRKPGGVAPQMEWNPKNNRMTLIVYFGTQPAVHIPLRPVREFSDDPWNS